MGPTGKVLLRLFLEILTRGTIAIASDGLTAEQIYARLKKAPKGWARGTETLTYTQFYKDLPKA